MMKAKSLVLREPVRAAANAFERVRLFASAAKGHAESAEARYAIEAIIEKLEEERDAFAVAIAEELKQC